MGSEERKEEILQLLRAGQGAIRIDALCAKIYASRSTIRRDLIDLETEGMITRHFGAVSLVHSSPDESSVARRHLENTDKKMLIGKAAGTYIHDGMVLFLDSSSTVSYLLPAIRAHRNLTIVTNSIRIAMELSGVPDIRCFICPGMVKTNSYSVIGEYASEFLVHFRAQTTFLSCKSIREEGIFEGSDSQALIKRRMIEYSDQVILLCDSSKENASGYFRLTGFDQLDLVISDLPLRKSIIDALSEEGCAFRAVRAGG